MLEQGNGSLLGLGLLGQILFLPLHLVVAIEHGADRPRPQAQQRRNTGHPNILQQQAIVQPQQAQTRTAHRPHPVQRMLKTGTETRPHKAPQRQPHPLRPLRPHLKGLARPFGEIEQITNNVGVEIDPIEIAVGVASAGEGAGVRVRSRSMCAGIGRKKEVFTAGGNIPDQHNLIVDLIPERRSIGQHRTDGEDRSNIIGGAVIQKQLIGPIVLALVSSRLGIEGRKEALTPDNAVRMVRRIGKAKAGILVLEVLVRNPQRKGKVGFIALGGQQHKPTHHPIAIEEQIVKAHSLPREGRGRGHIVFIPSAQFQNPDQVRGAPLLCQRLRTRWMLCIAVKVEANDTGLVALKGAQDLGQNFVGKGRLVAIEVVFRNPHHHNPRVSALGRFEANHAVVGRKFHALEPTPTR